MHTDFKLRLFLVGLHRASTGNAVPTTLNGCVVMFLMRMGSVAGIPAVSFG